MTLLCIITIWSCSGMAMEQLKGREYKSDNTMVGLALIAFIQESRPDYDMHVPKIRKFIERHQELDGLQNPFERSDTKSKGKQKDRHSDEEKAATFKETLEDSLDESISNFYKSSQQRFKEKGVKDMPEKRVGHRSADLSHGEVMHLAHMRLTTVTKMPKTIVKNPKRAGKFLVSEMRPWDDSVEKVGNSN